MEALPGGEWAWNLAKPAGEPLMVSGLTRPAMLSCTDEVCDIDLLVGRNWFRATSSNRESGEMRQQAIRLSELIVRAMR